MVDGRIGGPSSGDSTEPVLPSLRTFHNERILLQIPTYRHFILPIELVQFLFLVNYTYHSHSIFFKKKDGILRQIKEFENHTSNRV